MGDPQSIVALVCHAVLSAYVGYALARGAKSAARRELATACLAVMVFALTSAAGFLVGPPTDEYWFSASNGFVLLAAMYLLRFAWRLRSQDVRRTPWWWSAILAGGVGVTLEGMVRNVHSGPEGAIAAVLNLLAVVGVIVVLAIAARRGAPRAKAARAFLRAMIWPAVPLATHLAYTLGFPLFAGGLIRNVAVQLFLYSLLVAYIDHADEPLSLRSRFVAGTLTVVLATGSVTSAFLVHHDDDAIQLLALTLAGAIVVVVVFPRLLQRSFLAPLERLVAGMRQLEEGRRDVSLAVGHDDELGYVTRRFNHLVATLAEAEGDLAARIDELRAKNDEVRGLNDELREQIAARSRELAEAIERLGPEPLRTIGDSGVVDGRYRVGRVLGAGGMGTVYEVERLRDGRRLALKVMRTTSSDHVARFAREAQIAAPLDHENVVSIVDVGIWRGVAYLVMELVEGGSLEERRPRFGDVAWAMPVLGQIAAALAALHGRGIVHRDLKPPNVLLAESADRLVAKISDFGVAFQEADALETTLAMGEGDARLTGTGALIGTVPYMAPELALGGGRAAGTAADLFAFGIIAHELLTGESPFEVPPILVARRRRALPTPRPLPGSVPAPLAALLARCLCARPAERPTAQELVDAFPA